MSKHKAILSLILILFVQLVFMVFAEAQEVTLDLSDGTGPPGGTVSIQITLNKGGEPVSAVAMDIGFDASILSNPEARINSQNGGTDIDKQLISSEFSPGVFRIAVIPASLTQQSLEATIPDGLVAAVTFDISSNAVPGSKTTLTNTPSASTAAGQALPAVGRDATLEIKGLRGDLNNDGIIRSNDALQALRMAAGLPPPTVHQEWTDYQKWAADANEDGAVNAVDAMFILRMAAGFTAPGIDVISRSR